MFSFRIKLLVFSIAITSCVITSDSRPPLIDYDEDDIYLQRPLRNVHFHASLPTFIFMDNDGLPTPQCKVNGTILQVFDNCYYYAVCKDGIAVVEECPKEMMFDNVKLVCVDEKEGNCTLRCKKGHNSVHMDHLNNSIYYTCFRGELSVVECEPGTRYITEELKCVNPTVRGELILAENRRLMAKRNETAMKNKNRTTTPAPIDYTNYTFGRIRN